MKTRRKNSKGAAVLEASLTLMVFMMVDFSMADFGLSLYLHQSLVHRARTAARYGTINPDTAAIKNMLIYGTSAGGTGTGYYGLSPSTVSVTRTGTPTTATDRIVITLSDYSFTWVTPLWAGSRTGKPITISMPVEF